MPSAVRRLKVRIAGSELCRDILATYGTRVLVVAVTFVITIVVSRQLGPAGRGLYAVAVAVGAIGAQFGNFGLHASNTYFVARDRARLAALVGNSLSVLLLVCAAVIAIAIGFMHWPNLAPLHGNLLLLALASVPVGLAYLLFQGLLLGVHEVQAYNKIEFAGRLLALLLVGVAAFRHSKSVELFFGIGLLTLFISFMWALFRLKGISSLRPCPSWTMFRQSIKIGTKAYLIAFFGFLVLRIGLLMVKYMLGPSHAGFYSISQVLAENTMMFPVVVGLILFPKLSGIAEKKEKVRITINAVLITAALMLPVVLLAVLVARPVIALAFGRAFLPAATPFVWLMPGVYFLGIETVMVQLLNSEGFPRVIVGGWFGTTILNVGLNLWAIPRYGITGASIVSSICYFVMFLVISAVVWRRAYSPQPSPLGAPVKSF